MFTNWRIRRLKVRIAGLEAYIRYFDHSGWELIELAEAKMRLALLQGECKCSTR